MTATPQTLIDQLIQTHLTTQSHEEKTALAGFALALHSLAKANPVAAQDIVEWRTQNGGPNLGNFRVWAQMELASSPLRYEDWEADALKSAASQTV